MTRTGWAWLVAAVALGGVAGCGGSDGGEAKAPTGEDCEMVADLFYVLPQETLLDAAEAVPTNEEIDEALARLPALVAGDAQAEGDVALIREAQAAYVENPAAIGEAEREAGIAANDRLTRWAVGVCPPPAPIWACVARRKFTAVGQSINPPGEGGPELITDPADVVKREPGSPAPRVLHEDVDQQVLAEVGPDDLVTRAWLAEQEGQGWELRAEASCPDEGSGEGPEVPTDDGFEAVGESIEGN